MHLEVTALRTWMTSQYEHVKNIINQPIADAGDAAQFIRAQGGIDMLVALEQAIQGAEQRNLNAVETEAASSPIGAASQEIG